MPRLARLGIPAFHYEVETFDDLRNALFGVIFEDEFGESSDDPDVPVQVLHIPAHGHPMFTEFAFGGVGWPDLAALLGEVKDETLELGLFMSTCLGAEARRMLAHHEDPFDWLVGPTVPLAAGDLMEAASRFYTALRLDGDPDDGLAAVRDPRFVKWETVIRNGERRVVRSQYVGPTRPRRGTGSFRALASQRGGLLR